MKRTILAGLAIALGATGLMAQIKIKSKAEGEAINALITAAKSGDSDATIKAADDLLTKFCGHPIQADRAEYGSNRLSQERRRRPRAQVYAGRQVMQLDPKDFQRAADGRRDHRNA